MKQIILNKWMRSLCIFLVLLLAGGTGYIISGLNYIPPHYHTNFAVFISGEKFDFSIDEYSEDIGSCKMGKEVFPKERTHLHENNPDVIHVHHGGVTWGHFFANNGITFSNTHMSFENGKKILMENEKDDLVFILNNKKIDNPFNRYMISEDKLLIYYGERNDEAAITAAYREVKDSAGEYNKKYDPGSCSGSNDNSAWFLIKKMFHLTH